MTRVKIHSPTSHSPLSTRNGMRAGPSNLLKPAHPTARVLSQSWTRQHEEPSKPVTVAVRYCCNDASKGAEVPSGAQQNEGEPVSGLLFEDGMNDGCEVRESRRSRR